MRASLLLALVAALSSQAYAGLIKTGLKKKDVSSIAFDAPSWQACPGTQLGVEMVATLADGKALSTKGDVVWDAYEITSDLGVVGKRGAITLPSDPRETWGKVGRLSAVATDHPDKTATAELTASYACKFQASYYGGQGVKGLTGPAGSTGSTGLVGGSGGSGAAGGDGAPGSDLDVSVSLARHPSTGAPVLRVKIHDRTYNTEAYFAVDAEGGSLLIDASGGMGGVGGEGGVGGTGGSGTPTAPSGGGGVGGPGGPGGNGGPGGTISVKITPDAEPYLGRLSFANEGGPGGMAGQGGPGGNPGSSATGNAGARGAEGPDSYAGKPGQPGPRIAVSVVDVPAPW